MPITIYPGSMKKRNANGSYSDLVPAIATDPEVLDDFAEEYSTSETYNIGDYCIHNSDLYKCNTNNTTGTWNNNAWDRVSVADELADHKNTLTQLGNDLDGRVNSTQSTEAYVLGAKTADVSISGSGVYVIYNDALYTTTQSIASADTAPYTGKITPVPGGGLNSLKSNSVKSTSSRGFACNFTTENYDIILSSAAAADFNLPSSAEIIGVILQNIQNNGCTPIVYCYSNTIYARSNVVINTTLTICLLYK